MTNLTMAIPQPEIIQMLRKLGSKVIDRCRLQICNQISQIDNNLLVIWCTIFNWLTNKLTPQGNTKNSKSSSKVTANISNFTYSAITTGVLDPN